MFLLISQWCLNGKKYKQYENEWTEVQCAGVKGLLILLNLPMYQNIFIQILQIRQLWSKTMYKHCNCLHLMECYENIYTWI